MWKQNKILKTKLRKYFSFKVWKEGDEFPLHPSFEAYYLQILKLLSNASPRPPLIHSFHHVHKAVIGVHILLMLETHGHQQYQDLGFWEQNHDLKTSDGTTQHLWVNQGFQGGF